MRTRRWHGGVAGVGAGLLVALTLLGCTQPQQPTAEQGGQPSAQLKRGGVLAGAFGQPAFGDVHRDSGVGGPNTLSDVHRGLLQTDPQDRVSIVADIAERWAISPDGKTYTFSIRKGIKDSGGQPFTGEDVVYNFQRLQTRPNKLPVPRLGCVTQPVEKVELKDLHTVAVTLKHPKASYLACLSSSYALLQPKRALEPIDTAEKGRDLKPNEIIGVGPFKLERWERDVSFEVVPNPNYWEYPERPYLDKFISYVFSDTTAQAAAFRTGQIQFAANTSGGLRKGEVEELVAAMGNQPVVHKMGYPGFYGVHFNTKRPPFDQRDLRRAVYLVVDRNLHNRLVYDGVGGVPSPYYSKWDWLIPEQEYLTWPGLRSYQGGLREEDLAEARRLMEQQGYGPNNRLKVRHVTSASGYYNNDAQLLVDELKKIYIDLDVFRTQTGAELLAKGDFEIASHAVSLEFFDPDNYNEVIYGPQGGKNPGKWENSRWYALYEQQTKEMDQGQRARLLREMAKILVDDPPWVPTAPPLIQMVVSHEVRGFGATPPSMQFNQRHDYLWRDQ
ncbi:MAG: ABC transporter substrate-binding protein [Chloroflexi bacterium]|nr:ABC transporter substrate-binding protein [Chloroflexota bacterium]